MNGHIVSTPAQVHRCAPGWTYSEPIMTGIGVPQGTRIARPPGPGDYPKGTVWQCDCGRIWVSTGPIAPNAPGFIAFRPERRRERRKRERNAP